MLESKATITAGGRIVIPSAIRKALHIDIGQELILKVESGELHISTMKTAIERAKALVRKHNPKQKSLTDNLIASRREESKRE